MMRHVRAWLWLALARVGHCVFALAIVDVACGVHTAWASVGSCSFGRFPFGKKMTDEGGVLFYF